ncbi:hypothetical protein [Cereibacter johrii]|uniref:hypothetical protein n=1 Tax=Cereibacter johrii TaxID=445629 RepID=UPI000DCBEE09|nr:hypothetical protein [Cereibacter johrii]RAZ82107.1 hypothetical protein DDV93_20915 [Cereibacter johrii]
MPIPPRPPAPTPALRSNPETFSANAEATILYQWGAFPTWIEAIARFTEGQAEAALTAALGGDLPPLAGKAGQFLRVKADGSGPELVARPFGDSLEAAGNGILVKRSAGDIVGRILTTDANRGIQLLHVEGGGSNPVINGVTRTAAQWRDASDTTEAVLSPAKLAATLLALPAGVGANQSWQEVTASRALSTSYQNTTGRPILVFFVGQGSNVVQVSVDGSTWVKVGASYGQYTPNNTFIVPPGHYYRVNGSASGITWSELR